MKYHYCEEAGSGKQVCRQDSPPESQECQTFFKKNKQNVTDVPEDRDEILILQEISEKNQTYKYQPLFCFFEDNIF